MNTDNLEAFYYDYLNGNSYYKGLLKSKDLIEDIIKDLDDLKNILNDATGDIISRIVLKIDDLIRKLNEDKTKVNKVLFYLTRNAYYFDRVYEKLQKMIGKTKEYFEPSQTVNYSIGDYGGGYYATKIIKKITNVEINSDNYPRITMTIRNEKYFYKPLLAGFFSPPVQIESVCSKDNLRYSVTDHIYQSCIFHSGYFINGDEYLHDITSFIDDFN